MFEAPWTFAGDESGDTSFRFDRGATRHFVVAIIGTQQPEALRQALAELRQRRNLPANYEFSFHGTTACCLPRKTAQLAQARWLEQATTVGDSLLGSKKTVKVF